MPNNQKNYKTWRDKESGIIYMQMPKILTEQMLRQIMQEAIPLLKQASGKARLYVDLSITEPHLLTAAKTRKEILDIIKKAEKIGFEKAALLIRNITLKTILFFVVKAGGFTNFQAFKTKEEALKWLKE